MTKLQTIEQMIERLPISQKLILIKKLERTTAYNRMDFILKRIDERIKKRPITEKTIASEVKNARKRLYAKYYS